MSEARCSRSGNASREMPVAHDASFRLHSHSIVRSFNIPFGYHVIVTSLPWVPNANAQPITISIMREIPFEIVRLVICVLSLGSWFYTIMIRPMDQDAREMVSEILGRRVIRSHQTLASESNLMFHLQTKRNEMKQESSANGPH